MALHTVIKSDLDDDDDLRAAAMVRLTNSSWKARGHTLKPTLHSRGHIFVNLGVHILEGTLHTLHSRGAKLLTIAGSDLHLW